MFFDSNSNTEDFLEMSAETEDMPEMPSPTTGQNVFSYLSAVNANIGENFEGRWYNVTFTYFGSPVQNVRRILARSGAEAKMMLTNELMACMPINPGKVVGPARDGVTNRFTA